MKKISVAILMLLSLFGFDSAKAANYTREEMIMGMVDFGDTTTTGTIFLSEGIYIDPTTVLSINLNETISDSTFGTTNVTSMVMTLGVGAKKYLGEPAKSATVPYALGSAGFTMMLSSVDTPTTYTSSTDTGFSFQGGGGIAHFMTEAVSIDGTLQYYSNSIAGSTTSGIRLNAGITARY